MEQYKSKYTAQEIDEKLTNGESKESLLNKIKEVDGSGSGLNADKLDGYHLYNYISLPYKSFFKITEFTSRFIRIRMLNWSSGNNIIFMRSFGPTIFSNCIINVGSRENDFYGYQTFYGSIIVKNINKTLDNANIDIYIEINSLITNLEICCTDSSTNITITQDDSYSSKKYKPISYGLFSYGTINSNVTSADKLTTKELTNEDLNDIKDINFSNYYGIYTNTCLNKPEKTKSFGLNSYRISLECYCQILFDINYLSNYIRYYNINLSKWSDWKKMITEDDLSSLISRIEALENK